MAKIEKDGGPAFPCEIECPPYPGFHTPGKRPMPGMTLRDYFAGQALIGLMLTPGCLGINRLTVVESAYLMADTMLEVRKS